MSAQSVDLLGLVRLAQFGDMTAFEALYRRTATRVHALCLRMTADPALADECCQRTYVRAWEQLHTFRGDASLTTWLHRIAVNQVLMHRRTDTRRQARILPMSRPPDPQGRPPAEAAFVDLERALVRLPERARAVFVLHDVEGYRHAEVANMLGITVGTSKAQLHRARRLLRQELSHGL